MSDDFSDYLNTTTFTYSQEKPTELRGQPLPHPTLGGPVRVDESAHERSSRAFRFEHDAARGVFRLTSPEGKTEVFRDRPARYLCVEPDEQTGAMKPVLKHGRPVYLYLAREEREVR